MTLFCRFTARGAIIPFLKMVSRRAVNGLENIPREGGFITMASHLTNLDSLTAVRALVGADVPVCSLAKSTLFKVPVLGSILQTGGQIPIQRGIQNTATALRATSEILAGGGTVMIFPEDTLSHDPLRWPMVAETGAARLAMISGASILSMGRWGAHEVLDAYGRSFHPFPRKDVRVVIGELVDLSRFGQDTQGREAVRACIAEIMRAITALVRELREEKTPRPFDMHYNGDPGKGKIGVHRPDLLPEADTREKDQ